MNFLTESQGWEIGGITVTLRPFPPVNNRPR